MSGNNIQHYTEKSPSGATFKTTIISNSGPIEFAKYCGQCGQKLKIVYSDPKKSCGSCFDERKHSVCGHLL